MKFKSADKNTKVKLLPLVLKNPINKKTLLLALIVLFIISAFTAGVIAQRNYGFSNIIAKPIILDSPGIIKRKILSNFTNPEILKIDLKYEDHMKLMFNLDNALSSGTTRNVENEWIDVGVQNQSDSYKGKVRLKGAIAEQHLVGKKWSFRLKLKKEDTIFGMREFAVMSPIRRNFLGQWFIRKVYEKEGLVTRKYNFINLILNGENKGIYVVDERYDKIMLERNQRKEGPVMKVDAIPLHADESPNYDNYYLSMDLTAFDLDELLEKDITRNQFFTAKDLMEKFRLGELKTSEVFDVELLAKWFAVGDVMGAWHGFSFDNMRFYFNPITSKFEPVPDDDYNERSLNYSADFRRFRLNDTYNNSLFLRNLFTDNIFVEEYMKQLVKISDNEYLDELFNNFNDEIKRLSNILAKDYPLYNFLSESKKNIYNNASFLSKKLYFHKGVQSHLKNIQRDESIEITIANNHSIPMEILYISDKFSNIYKPLSEERLIINSREFMKPVSHTSHFFKLSSKGNKRSEDFSDLSIAYRVIGTKKLLTTEIFSYKEFIKNNAQLDFIREKSNINDFTFLDWDKHNNEIKFKKGNWQISSDLIVPANQKLIIPQDVNIDLINSSMILSYSPVLITGSEDNFIEIYSSDNSGQGITLLNSKKKSLIKYVKFNGLSNPDKNGFKLTGVVNFYQSPIHFHETHFKGNLRGDDYLNIIRSDFSITNSSISNTFSDAIDIDFSNGLIRDSFFLNCGIGNNNGDCIDLSGSIVNLKSVNINQASDKGISIGEHSNVNVNDTSISQSNVALASKDFSEVIVNNLLLSNSTAGISVFQKKPEFGPASVIINGIEINEVINPYLVEESSFLSVNNKIVK
ncbi:CotH kinase family protein [Alphaproteobacteria bacterium]|nr:CotH kinase family protein [Alphaproteobacteria bacterium]